MKRAFVLLAPLLFACGPSVDARYAAAQARADAMTSAGRHADAALRWLDAARVAESASDREEAEYRAAASYERAGKSTEALALYERLERGSGDRAARASFDRARIVAKGDSTRGDELLLAAIRRHPDSGLAPRAVREHLERVESRAGQRAALDVCTSLTSELAATELDETLRYERGRLLERQGSYAAARDAFLDTAARHPYPTGALWDDALVHAASCEERLGRPLAAIALLERMLAERESSWKVASYDRAHYAEARFHIAELFRDRLGEPERARKEFRRVYDEHPTSLLRDDALWQEALIAHASKDPASACAPLGLLVRELADSRYAPCAEALCPTVRAATRKSCGVVLPETAAPAPAADHSSSSSSSSSSP